MLNNEEIQEIINREENHIDDILSVIEKYIFDKKGVNVKIHYDKNEIFFIHRDFNLIMRAYDSAIKYYKQRDERIQSPDVH